MEIGITNLVFRRGDWLAFIRLSDLPAAQYAAQAGWFITSRYVAYAELFEAPSLGV